MKMLNNDKQFKRRVKKSFHFPAKKTDVLLHQAIQIAYDNYISIDARQ